MAAMLLLFVVPALLAIAAGWDLASFTIPNFLSLALIAAFALFAVATGMTPAPIGAHLLAGVHRPRGRLHALRARLSSAAATPSCSRAIVLWLGFANLLDFTRRRLALRRCAGAADPGPASCAAAGGFSWARAGSCACTTRRRAFPTASRSPPAPCSFFRTRDVPSASRPAADKPAWCNCTVSS